MGAPFWVGPTLADTSVMKFRVKLGIIRPDGSSSRIAVNLADGDALPIGEVLLEQYRIPHAGEAGHVFCSLQLRKSVLFIRSLAPSETLLVNEMEGNGFSLKPGDLVKIAGYAFEILEAPVSNSKNKEVDTQFIDLEATRRPDSHEDGEHSERPERQERKAHVSRADRQRAERERAEHERAEHARVEHERAEHERAEHERSQRQRAERERAESADRERAARAERVSSRRASAQKVAGPATFDLRDSRIDEEPVAQLEPLPKITRPGGARAAEATIGLRSSRKERAVLKTKTDSRLKLALPAGWRSWVSKAAVVAIVGGAGYGAYSYLEAGKPTAPRAPAIAYIPASETVPEPAAVPVPPASAPEAPARAPAAKPPAPKPPTPLSRFFAAIDRGDTDTLQIMTLSKEVDPASARQEGRTPLIEAVRYGQVAVVAYLLRLKPDLNAKDSRGDTAFAYAKRENQLEIMRMLGDGAAEKVAVAAPRRPAHVRQSPPPPPPAPLPKLNTARAVDRFFVALKEDDVQEMKKMIAAKEIDPVTAVWHGRTPLMQATRYGQIEAVRYLLQTFKLSLNAQDPKGDTALMYAARQNQVEIAAMLVKKGADASIRSSSGESPGEVAMLNDRLALMKALENKSERRPATKSGGN